MAEKSILEGNSPGIPIFHSEGGGDGEVETKLSSWENIDKMSTVKPSERMSTADPLFTKGNPPSDNDGEPVTPGSQGRKWRRQSDTSPVHATSPRQNEVSEIQRMAGFISRFLLNDGSY